MWVYGETSEYIKSSEKLGLSDEVRGAIKSWAQSVGRVQTNKQKNYFKSEKGAFEIWSARIPDPDTNTGSSGGFRLIYFFNLKDCSVFVDRVEKRSKMGFKREHPREKQKFENYLLALKKYLIIELENNNCN